MEGGCLVVVNGMEGEPGKVLNGERKEIQCGSAGAVLPGNARFPSTNR